MSVLPSPDRRMSLLSVLTVTNSASLTRTAIRRRRLQRDIVGNSLQDVYAIHTKHVMSSSLSPSSSSYSSHLIPSPTLTSMRELRCCRCRRGADDWPSCAATDDGPERRATSTTTTTTACTAGPATTTPAASQHRAEKGKVPSRLVGSWC